MDGEVGIYTTDCFEFTVVKSPLIGQIFGGATSRYAWNRNVTLDAWSETFDPDCDEELEDCDAGWTFE